MKINTKLKWTKLKKKQIRLSSNSIFVMKVVVWVVCVCVVAAVCTQAIRQRPSRLASTFMTRLGMWWMRLWMCRCVNMWCDVWCMECVMCGMCDVWSVWCMECVMSGMKMSVHNLHRSPQASQPWSITNRGTTPHCVAKAARCVRQ